MTAGAAPRTPRLLGHAQGTVLDLPIDVQLVLLLGAGAVVGTAAWLVRRDSVEQSPPPRRRPPASSLLTTVVDHRVTRVALRAAGLVGLAVVLVLAVAGPARGDRSALPRLVTVVCWGGVLASSVVVGPWYRAVDPLRTLASGIARLAGSPPRPLPAWLGRWPAAAGSVVAAGLAFTALDAPVVVAAVVLAYVAVHLVAGAWWGASWSDQAEALTVLSDLAGRVALLGRRADRRIGLRDPVLETTRDSGSPGTLAVVAAVVGAALWEAIAEALGATPGAAAMWLGLLATVALVAAVLRLARPQPYLEGALIPLVAAYGVLLVGVPLLLDGPLAFSLLSDPLGARAAPPRLAATGVVLPVDAAVVAAVQTVVFVACHVLAVAVAHRSSLARHDLRGARAVMFPVRALLLGSVVAGLWLPTLGA